jgi:type I restriction enzyme R subunit
MSNFQFLKQEWPELHESAAKAEAYVLGDARSACFYARRSLELAVEWLYDHDPVFKAPYEKSLGALIAEPTFRQNVGQGLHNKAKIIKDLGNQAVHTNRPIRQWDAQQIVGELFHFLYWVARTYTLKSPQDYAGLAFNVTLLPKPPETFLAQSAEQLQKLEIVLKEKDAALAEKVQALASKG